MCDCVEEKASGVCFMVDAAGPDVIYKVSSYLDMRGVHAFGQACKAFESNRVDTLDVAKIKTSRCLADFYEVINHADTRALNVSPADLVNKVPFIKTLVDEYQVYDKLVREVLYRCQHGSSCGEAGTDICEVCTTIYYQYERHWKGKKIFGDLTKPASWMTAVAMCLYH